MGAWGGDIFDNDAAADFGHDVVEISDLDVVEGALDALLEPDEDADPILDGYIASQALAAADIVARLRGHFGQQDAYTEDLDAWVRRTSLSPRESLVQKAKAVVELVRTPPSALLEEWSEDDPTAWLDSLDALRQRLDAPPVPKFSGGFFQRMRSKYVN